MTKKRPICKLCHKPIAKLKPAQITISWEVRNQRMYRYTWHNACYDIHQNLNWRGEKLWRVYEFAIQN